MQLRIVQSIICCTIIVSCTLNHQGLCSLFKVQPRNKTVKYGEITQFECQIHVENSQDLHMYFGNTIIYPLLQGNFSTLDQREFSVDINRCTNCLQNETVVGQVWILLNSITLQIIGLDPGFWCRVHHSRTFEDSDVAFVKVIYPECTVSFPQSDSLLDTSTFLPQTELPTNLTSVSVQALNRQCSAGNIKDYNIAISICAGLALVMLTLLIVTYMCICIQHRKQLSCAKSSKLSRDQACKSMVDNPIYESDGPVYDSVQPQFNSLTSQVTAATNAHTEIKLYGLESSASVQQFTDKNHYVSQPSLTQSGSFSFIAHSNDHPITDEQLALQDGQGCSHCTTNMHNDMIEDAIKCGEMLWPGRIGCSSLSDGWDEQDPKEIRKDNTS